MRLNKFFVFIAIAGLGLTTLTFQACSQMQAAGVVGSAPAISLPNGLSIPTVTGNNVMRLTVNGDTCAGNTSYFNEPCVDVVICSVSSPSTCVTIPDVLLDTGSYGLRVFKSAFGNYTNGSTVLSGLTTITSGSNTLAECVEYGDGSADWGPVEKAVIQLGNENPVTVPMQIIDSTFGTVPAGCPSPDTSPSNSGFNGILGVGLFANDCGATCLSANSRYWSCPASGSCTETGVTIANQVTNPVSALSQDNNGVVLSLPQVDVSGNTDAVGYLILGINTQTNNTMSSSVVTYQADTDGEFTTSINGTSYTAFIDSGSNALYFHDSNLPSCSYGNASFYCPGSITQLSAIIQSASGSPSGTIAFNIVSPDQLGSGSTVVFSDIGGDDDIGGSSEFDWGLPFFLGRNVYVGIEQTNLAGTVVTANPYWSF